MDVVSVTVVSYLFVNDRIDVVGFFMRLNHPRLFLLVEVY